MFCSFQDTSADDHNDQMTTKSAGPADVERPGLVRAHGTAPPVGQRSSVTALTVSSDSVDRFQVRNMTMFPATVGKHVWGQVSPVGHLPLTVDR